MTCLGREERECHARYRTTEPPDPNKCGKQESTQSGARWEAQNKDVKPLDRREDAPDGQNAEGRQSGRDSATHFPLGENTMDRFCAAATAPRIRRRRRREEGEKVLRENSRASPTDAAAAENPGRADLVRKRAYLHGAHI